MLFIYVHHALRKRHNGSPSQEDGIERLGVIDAKITAKIIKQATKKIKISKLYCGSYIRYKKTANIINKQLNLPIIEDIRLNEFYKSIESWIQLQQRVLNFIQDIANSHDDNDCVICITSGVNIISFILAAMNKKPYKDAPFIGVPSCSPMAFEIKKNKLND